jgi:hypothetical protein
VQPAPNAACAFRVCFDRVRQDFELAADAPQVVTQSLHLIRKLEHRLSRRGGIRLDGIFEFRKAGGKLVITRAQTVDPLSLVRDALACHVVAKQRG